MYKYNLWGFGSGIGSISFLNKKYIDFVNTYLNNYPDIKTIVDIGCGDWQIAKHFKLGNRKYVGCDVSDYILRRTKETYQNENTTFIHLDAVYDELPKGDLVLIKEVLQHLSNNDVKTILDRLDNYKYVIIGTSIIKNGENNKEINAGQWRGIDITKPPFNKKGYKIELEYVEIVSRIMNFFKRILNFPYSVLAIYVRTTPN